MHTYTTGHTIVARFVGTTQPWLARICPGSEQPYVCTHESSLDSEISDSIVCFRAPAAVLDPSSVLRDRVNMDVARATIIRFILLGLDAPTTSASACIQRSSVTLPTAYATRSLQPYRVASCKMRTQCPGLKTPTKIIRGQGTDAPKILCTHRSNI